VTEELAAKLPRAVIPTGVGDVFSAGADVAPGEPHNAAMAEAVQKKEPTKVRPWRVCVWAQRPVLEGSAGGPRRLTWGAGVFFLKSLVREA